MKTRMLILCISLLFNCSCKAQLIKDEDVTVENYPVFYSQTLDALNKIIPNKMTYYNKPLSVFLSAITKDGVTISAFDTLQNTYLTLYFIWSADQNYQISRQGYTIPNITVYFKNPFNFQQASKIMQQNHVHWNETSVNFFKDLIVEKIEFAGTEGLRNKSNDTR